MPSPLKQREATLTISSFPPGHESPLRQHAFRFAAGARAIPITGTGMPDTRLPARISSRGSFWSTVARQWLITVACLCAAAVVAKTMEKPKPAMAECAARDLRLITVIEERGEAQDVASDRLAQAARIMMWARDACQEGRIAQALAAYDVALSALSADRPGPMTPQGGWGHGRQAHR
jgi:hypothetical protein